MSEDRKRIRKQMYDLSLEDFQEHPVWEFCLDEENVDGQTEETVRPSDLRQLPANTFGSFLIATDVLFGNGTQTLGYLFSDERDVSSALPAAFINDKCVPFAIPGSRGFLTNERVNECKQRYYNDLAMERGSVFPVAFRSLIPVNGAPMNFVLDGFILLCGSGQTVR